MELLKQAVNSNDFGLRNSFPWGDGRGGDTEARIDCRNISLDEKSYLSGILGSQIPNMDDGFTGRIENPYLWSRYVLRYQEMRAEYPSSSVTEHIVIHATTISAAYEIAENNFDWRLVRRHRFGQGVSFAADVSYAANQATEKDAYIISGILVARSKVGKYETRIPPKNMDTTTNHRRNVYVKYYDSDFYPYYIVY